MNLLIEFQTEEIPARMQPTAEVALKRIFESFCIEEQIPFQNLEINSTPRRLVLECSGLPNKQPDQLIEQKGPRTDSPQAAQNGFLRSVGLTSDNCDTVETSKGTFWIARLNKIGALTQDLVPQFIESVLKTFPWPKSMKWGKVPFQWIRPLHQILVLLDNSPLSGNILSIPLVSTTTGHRFLGEKTSKTLASIEEYHQFLKTNFVMLTRSQRKQTIRTQLSKIEKLHNVTWKDDPALLEEVAGLVEYPFTISGTIDQAFMELPQELTVSVMKTHQRYFSFFTHENKLAPTFGVTANNLTSENLNHKVQHGNEKVLRARLSDGQFYWKLDLNTPLATLSDKLSKITFHQKLGTLKDKRNRIVHTARFLNQWFALPQDILKEAALYCKSDLVSGVVSEFPELQGIMGGYYASLQGKAEISVAITDHYKPLGPSDSLPRDLTGITLALADKLDTLVGFFAINEKPTGSKDPFALRRSALGILRLIFEAYYTHGKEFTPPLDQVIHAILLEYKETLGLSFEIHSITKEIVMFLTERLKVSLKDSGIRADIIESVLASSDKHTVLTIKKKSDILSKFLSMSLSDNLISGYNRLWKLLNSQKLQPQNLDVDPALLKEESEQILYKEWKKRSIESLVLNQSYEQALTKFTELKPFIDRFLDKILVNVPDDALRQNRLALIVIIIQSIKSFAAIEKIAHDK